MDSKFLKHAFGVREGYECVHTEYRQEGIELTLAVKKLGSCPACGEKEVVRKGKRYRYLQTVPIGLTPVVLKAEVPQCQCKTCKKTFEVSPPLPKPTYDTPGDWANMSMP